MSASLAQLVEQLPLKEMVGVRILTRHLRVKPTVACVGIERFSMLLCNRKSAPCRESRALLCFAWWDSVMIIFRRRSNFCDPRLVYFLLKNMTRLSSPPSNKQFACFSQFLTLFVCLRWDSPTPGHFKCRVYHSTTQALGIFTTALLTLSKI